MKYVIIGAGVAGVEAAKVIRAQEESAEIVMISADTQIHSRCMLHKYIAGERDEKGLDFTEEDFFGRYNIRWMSGVRLSKVCPDQKEAVLDNGSRAGTGNPDYRLRAGRPGCGIRTSGVGKESDHRRDGASDPAGSAR